MRLLGRTNRIVVVKGDSDLAVGYLVLVISIGTGVDVKMAILKRQLLSLLALSSKLNERVTHESSPSFIKEVRPIHLDSL